MAYSMFECPKLHNAKSLKFYPEQNDHHISYRHKNLPPDFELVEKPNYPQEYSLKVQNSVHRKCPIYVHDYPKAHHYDGDFIPKSRKKTKSKSKAAMEKLEETYWANWKPERNGSKISGIPPIPVTSSCRSPEIQVIKSAPKRKIQLYPNSEDNIVRDRKKVVQKNSKSQEIQTEEILEVGKSVLPSVSSVMEETVIKEVVEEVSKEKFLKHTDSLILNMKKAKEEKEHFEQPKCIRLYKKTTRNSSRQVTKGGSYPLKSCLKKDSILTKNSSKLGRPGSPMIVSSHYSTKTKHGKSYNKH